MSELDPHAAPGDTTSAGTPGRFFTRRKFLTCAALATGGLAFYSGEIARHQLDVVRLTIHLPGLADSFHGMTIAQLSDIHYDNFTEPFFVDRAVRRINALHPDLVLLTGDFVSKGPQMVSLTESHAQLCAAALSHIACPHRYAIMGNHDYAVGVDLVTDALQGHDIPVLWDAHTALERGSDRLWLVGLKDISAPGPPNLARAMPPKGTEPTIVMVHEPDYMDDLMASPLGRRADLVLAGHTHGGQICVPVLGATFRPPLGKNYVSGLFHFPHENKTSLLYVNRGLGTVGLPLRLYCPPEITLITLSAQLV